MTFPPVIRVFFAIDLPQTIKENVSEFIETLKKRYRSKNIRWTKITNLHITLHFLQALHTERLQKLITQVQEGMHECSPFTFTLDSLRLYPNPYRPRVIVVEIKPQDELKHLVQLMGTGISAMGYEVETRPFRGHLTLGRIKNPRSVHLDFLADYPLPKDVIHVSEVILFRSEPTPEGSTYTQIATLPLTQPMD